MSIIPIKTTIPGLGTVELCHLVAVKPQLCLCGTNQIKKTCTLKLRFVALTSLVILAMSFKVRSEKGLRHRKMGQREAGVYGSSCTCRHCKPA